MVIHSRLCFTLLTAAVTILDEIMSQPIVKRNQPTGDEYWILPCGGTPTPTPGPDSNQANMYGLQLQRTLAYVLSWNEDFVQSKFHMSFDEKYAEDDGNNYPWLLVDSTIPKKTGQHLNSSHYSTESFDKMLTQSSDILQRFAVAWEQVVFEAIPFPSAPSKDQFADTQMRLKQTLCTLHCVLVGKGMNPATNPTRSIMLDELRNLSDGSVRDMRNFRIIKDYINALEYFADGFDYFALPSSL